MGILDNLKSLYFRLEEKYYRFLDRIDERIPIYKIIEPIDKIVPSFALFIMLAVLLLVVLGAVIVGWLTAPTTTTLKLTVVDDEGYLVPDATVTFNIEGELAAESLSDEQGIAELSGLDLETAVEVIVEKEGYLSNDASFTITEFPIQPESIEITIESRGLTTKTIRLVDDLGMAIGGDFTLSFSCSNPYADAPGSIALTAADNGEATVDVANNCETLRVTVSDLTEYESYGPVAVIEEPFLIYLSRAVVGRATIAAVVLAEDGSPIDGITVELYRYNELATDPNVGPVDVDYTSGGRAEFNWQAGSYVLKTYDSSGVYGEEQSGRIDVGSGETHTENFTLTESIEGQIKIQVKDKRSGAIIDNAKVTLYVESSSSELTSLTTDAEDNDGIVTFNISRDVPYKAVVEADGYALGAKFGLRISETAIVVELERCAPLTCGKLLVRVVDQDGDFIENATVALYNARTNFLAGYSNKTTDINGLAKFRGVSSGNYKAFAFKESNSGWSDETYFSSTVSDDDAVDLTVSMQIPNGIVRVKVRDRDGKPVPFPIISIYNAYNNELIGSDYADVNGVYNRETKADKRVYIVVKKKDSTPKMADYITIEKPVLPLTVQLFDVIMQPEIIDEEVTVKFLGLYKNDKLATTLGIGGEYTAKMQLMIPEDRDYSEAGVHLRTGKDRIVEKDQLFIKSLNAPNAAIIKAASYDDGSRLGEDDYSVTASDAKWANIVWEYAEAGIYELEAAIKVKETASVGDELLINYRAWAENSERIRDPEDDYVVEELYAETYTERYQVGVTTLCDRDFCFSSTITDLEEGLTESITESYQAKIYNEYLWRFTLQNNSDTRIHNSADLRIENRGESILFGNYLIYDAQSRPISGTVNDYEFERIDAGRLEPKNKVNAQEIYFVTQKATAALINIRLVSDQRIVFEKNLTISITAPKELEAILFPTSYPSGIENDINVLVRDKSTKLEIEDAIVRVKDKFGNVIIYNYTGKDGYAYLTLPAQAPGTKLWIEVEKPNYNTETIEIEINPDVLEIQPARIGVSLNIKTRPETDDKFSVRNLTTFPLKITSILLEGTFRALLDEERIANWLEASYKDLVIEQNERIEMHLKTYLSDDGKVIGERTDLEGKLFIEATNFGQTWVFSVPVNIAIGLGEEVDDPACLILTRGDWIASTEGEPISLEFEIQNNCAVAGNPVGLRMLEAKAEWKGNHLGSYSITIGENETELRSGYSRTLLGRIPAETGYSAILTFAPYGGMDGADEAEIVIQARNPLDEKDQILAAKIKTKITVVNIRQCISFDRDLIEMEYGESAAFTITTKDCGEAVDFELISELDLSADEFSMGETDSKQIEVLASDNYPGQYPVFIKSKLAGEAKKQLIHTIRTRIMVPATSCITLNRYEFDVYDSLGDPYDGYDTAELTNRCPEQEVKFKVDMKDFEAALKDGAKWGLVVFGVGLLGKGLGSLLPSWLGGEGEIEQNYKVVKGELKIGDKTYKNAYVGSKDGRYYFKSGKRYRLIEDQDTKIVEKADTTVVGVPAGKTPPPTMSRVKHEEKEYKRVGGVVAGSDGSIDVWIAERQEWIDARTREAKDSEFTEKVGTGPAVAPAGEPEPTITEFEYGGEEYTRVEDVIAGSDRTIYYWDAENQRWASYDTDAGFGEGSEFTARAGTGGAAPVTKTFEYEVFEYRRVGNTITGSDGSTYIWDATNRRWVNTETGFWFDEDSGFTYKAGTGTAVTPATGRLTLINLISGEEVSIPYEEFGSAMAEEGMPPAISGYLLGFPFGGGEGLFGEAGMFGMASGIIDGILGKGNPIMQGLKAWLIASFASYFGQEPEKEFRTTKPDLEVTDISLLASIGREEAVDTDVSIAQPEEEYFERDIESGRKVERRGLVFTNETGFTTTEEEPAYKWLKVSGNHHIYNTEKVYGKDDFEIIDEKGWFAFSGGEERIDPESGMLDEKDPEEIKEYFHLEFNSVPPEGPAEEVRGLLNCQAGTKQGTTGDAAFFGENAPLRIKLSWDWGSISENECDVGNNGFIYCDATQFSIEVLKKINIINEFLRNNGSRLVCPSPLDVYANTATIGSYDIGISKIGVDKAGNNVKLTAEITNTNPSQITTDLELYVTNLDTDERIDCAETVSPLTVLSKEDVECTFPLADGDYVATATITPTIDCANCKNKTASDRLSIGFTAGATGLEQCEPYTTKRLGGAAGFFHASGLEGAEVEAVGGAITFQAHLIRDRYSSDFQYDFDSYSLLESFFNAPSYYKDNTSGLGIYFKDFELTKFVPKYGEANPEGYLLPGPGIYNVTINITYNDDSWQLFDEEDQPNATIRIELDKADVPEPDSPFYYLPFDGPIGFNGRVGYGVNYRGDVVTISNDPESVRTIEMAGSTPIPNGQLTVTYSDSFKRLNNDERGEIFSITRGESPTIVYSPSYATPVMIKIHNEREDAFGFYEVEAGGGAQNVGASMSKWYGIGINCKSFSDRPVVEEFWETTDIHGLRQYRDCSILPEEKAATSYGFEFCNPVLFGNLYLKSIFYTPYGKQSYMKKVVGNDSMVLIGNVTADSIELNGARDLPTEIHTVVDMIDLVKDGYVCVSSTDTKAEFWWNPKAVFESDNFQRKEDQAVNDCITD